MNSSFAALPPAQARIVSQSQVARRPRALGSALQRSVVRPYVVVNMAMTADGKIATANRSVSSFGSRADHDHLLELRATADAVMCGAGTAAGENITMGPGPLRFRRQRLRRGLAEFNLRIIASGSGTMNPKADIFRHRFSPIIVIVSGRAPRSKLGMLKSVAEEVVQFGDRTLDLSAALTWLRTKRGVKRLICEGGGTLNDAMFRAGLVDEVHLTVCPLIFGGRNAPTISDGRGFSRLLQSIRLKLKSRRSMGEEQFLVYTVLPVGASLPRTSDQRAISHNKSARRLK